jgi:hypothetical protein
MLYEVISALYGKNQVNIQLGVGIAHDRVILKGCPSGAKDLINIKFFYKEVAPLGQVFIYCIVMTATQHKSTTPIRLIIISEKYFFIHSP